MPSANKYNVQHLSHCPVTCMTTAECEPGTNVPCNDVPPVSVTSKLNAKSRRLAKNLNDLKHIYAFHGALDGGNLTYSMIKWWFDLICTDSDLSSSDMMHDWMISPEGIAATSLEAITLIMFSMLANVYDDDDKNVFKRYIAIAWPYVRDTGKAFKNAFKGTRSALQAFGVISGQDARYLIVPVGVLLGVLSAVNRYAMRMYVVEPRKEMMKANGLLLQKIQGTHFHILDALPLDFGGYENSYVCVGDSLYFIDGDTVVTSVAIDDKARFTNDLIGINPKSKTCLYLTYRQIQDMITANGGHVPPISGLNESQCDWFREQKRQQIPEVRQRALLGAAYGGIVDGLYLYMGSMGLAVLSPIVFAVMASFCVIFTLMCIATRVYEEYHFQRRLVETQAKIELALCGKALEGLLAKLQRLSDPLDKTQENEISIQKEQALTLEKLTEKMKEFEDKSKFLRSQVVLSNTSRALSGLRNGLAAYSAIASLMFAVATIDAVFFTAFSPALMVFGISLGMVCLLIFMTYSLLYQLPPEPDKNKAKAAPGGKVKQTIWDLCQSIKEKNQEVGDLKPTVVKEAISNGMMVDRSPQFYFQEGFEVARSVCSGVTKGQKSVDFTLNPLQEADQDGHYHDSSVMIGFMVLSAALHAVVFGLRALARGFGRDELDEAQEAAVPSAARVPPFAEREVASEPVVPKSTTPVASAEKAADGVAFEPPGVSTADLKDSLEPSSANHHKRPDSTPPSVISGLIKWGFLASSTRTSQLRPRSSSAITVPPVDFPVSLSCQPPTSVFA